MWNEPTGTDASPHPASTFQIVSVAFIDQNGVIPANWVGKLYSSDDAPKKCIIQDLVSPAEWNKKLSSLAALGADGRAFTTLVCGPKSAGKSTFSKILTNRLVTRRPKGSRSTPPGESQGVAVLDLDPGQPEYAVPGTLSLVHVTQPNLSAPFTHASLENPAFRVLRCHALASVSPASDPDCYRECVVDLHDEYRRALGNLPLIINTPGWILGTGLELLGEIIKHTSPSEVVYMSEEGPAEAVELLQAATAKVFSTLPSQPAEFTSRTGAHLRAMQTMSYFHSLPPNGSLSSGRSGQKWNPAPLTTVRPWQVKYAGPDSGITGILSYDYQSPPDLLADTINGAVLAAVEIEGLKAYRSLLEQQSTTPRILQTPEGIPLIRNPDDSTLDPQYSQTVGLVLVRGIDVARQSLQLITPIPLQKMQDIRKLGRHIVLVHGKFDAPNWAYTEDLYQRSGEEEVGTRTLEVEHRDTSEDDSDMEPENVGDASDMTAVPWVEILKGHDKRPVGSKVWRVRRDLGRTAGDG
jgi:polynucleotide 5'-hydroxyl-kinase GRC3/NOL9